MLVSRTRSRVVLAVLLAFAVLFGLHAASPADAASRGGPDGFFDQLLSILAPKAPAPAPQPIASRRSDPLAPYSGSGKAPARSAPVYRTVCVRLCDGYYWPVSNATTESHFRRDGNTCASSCSQPARLYYAPNGDSDASQLIGLDGQPYTSLATAFLYRKALQPQCQCKPAPWADSEILRHKQYAMIVVQQAATSPPLAQPQMASDEPAPLPDTAGQPGNAAAVANDGAIAASADPAPVVLRPTSAALRPVPAVAKPRRLAKPARQPQAFSDPLSFSVETVDRGSHRYIPLR